MLKKFFGNTALKASKEDVTLQDVETIKVSDFQNPAANDDNASSSTGEPEQTLQSPSQDYRDGLEQKYQNHNIVKHNSLLRAKVSRTALPVDEKSMRKVFDGVVRDFGLEAEDLSFEHFKLLATDVDEQSFRAQLIEVLPAEKLEMAKNMHPTKAEMQVIDNLPLEYEHIDVQKELLSEMQVQDLEEAKIYHARLKEDLKSPLDEYLEIQTEIDGISSLEVEHEDAVQDISSQSIGGSFDDKVAYLFDDPQAALDKSDKMISSDSKADAMQFVDARAGRDAIKGFDEGVGEAFREKDMQETITDNFEVLGEANMKGGQDLTGGDNDLRTAIKRDAAKGSISQDTIELQASEQVELDDKDLLRKAGLEQRRDDLLAENGPEIAADITKKRAELGLEPMEINSPESLALAVQNMQVELEKRQEEQSADMDLAPEMSRKG